jgi:hypothetical protein
MARTSNRISTMAARYAGLTPDNLLSLTATEALRDQTAADVRSMAASLLRQDEVKGLRKLFRKLKPSFEPTFMSDKDRP